MTIMNGSKKTQNKKSIPEKIIDTLKRRFNFKADKQIIKKVEKDRFNIKLD